MSQKKEKIISNYDTTGELGFDEMFGAIFYMLLGRLKREYEYYHQIEFQRKNIITGYLLKLFFVFGAIALFYFLFS